MICFCHFHSPSHANSAGITVHVLNCKYQNIVICFSFRAYSWSFFVSVNFFKNKNSSAFGLLSSFTHRVYATVCVANDVFLVNYKRRRKLTRIWIRTKDNKIIFGKLSRLHCLFLACGWMWEAVYVRFSPFIWKKKRLRLEFWREFSFLHNN